LYSIFEGALYKYLDTRFYPLGKIPPPPPFAKGGNRDIALLASTWSLVGTGPDGKPVRKSGQGREVVRRQPDGTWRFGIDAPNGLG
jgi:hypothetical protein